MRVLLWLSFLAGGLLVARIAYSRELTHVFLLWNLFLAWLPLVFAVFVWRSRQPLVRAASGVLWLLFLPNAPYLITDLIHLAPSTRAPMWYDVVLLFTAALGGLLLGLRSLLNLLSYLFLFRPLSRPSQHERSPGASWQWRTLPGE